MRIIREKNPYDGLQVRTTYTTDNFRVVSEKTTCKEYIIVLRSKAGHYITTASSYDNYITAFREARRKYMLQLFSHI